MKNKIFKRDNIIAFLAVSIFVAAVAVWNGEGEKPEYKNQINETIQLESRLDVCDGIYVIEDCELGGIIYSVYKYYPAVEEISHTETKTTHTKEIVGYCTLCNDGTRSPSCSVGRGTCSYHGGVAEWDAPIYEDVPHYEEVNIIDSPAIEERYEIIIK